MGGETMGDHGPDHHHDHDHDHGHGARDDLNLIDQPDEQLPADPAPEATEEADLTVNAVDEDTSKDVDLEEDESPPGARPPGSAGDPS
jgi:hypothetical protein